MAWGTTIDSLTLEINPFLYAREIKYLKLKDQNSYLIGVILQLELIDYFLNNK